jgi:uncharacterized protein YbjT (DUF2867 family)
MRILLTGATGFIGSRLAAALRHAGHDVIATRRRAPRGADADSDGDSEYVFADFSRDHSSDDWEPRLAGVDAVINAVGIIQERGTQTFDALHTHAPRALFEACSRVGVPRIIQISALGAETALTPYFASKHRADDFLASLPLAWTIFYPSLVYGDDGASAKLFRLLASSPLIPLLGDGMQRVQPVHIDDLVAAVVAALDDPSTARQRIPIVGPQPSTMREYLMTLRRSMGLRATWYLPIPLPFVRFVAALASTFRIGLLDRDTLAMLNAGNAADPAPVARLLRRPPRAARQFIDARYGRFIGIASLLGWLLPLLRYSIAVVWLWSGITSFGLYPREMSYAMLSASGIPPLLQPATLIAAAVLDVLLGVATLALRRRRALWVLQIAVMITYTSILSFAMPELWLHPFGPVLKNLPMLAAVALLYYLEPLTERR